MNAAPVEDAPSVAELMEFFASFSEGQAPATHADPFFTLAEKAAREEGTEPTGEDGYEALANPSTQHRPGPRPGSAAITTDLQLGPGPAPLDGMTGPAAGDWPPEALEAFARAGVDIVYADKVRQISGCTDIARIVRGSRLRAPAYWV